jgi:hypothetical protein
MQIVNISIKWSVRISTFIATIYIKELLIRKGLIASLDCKVYFFLQSATDSFNFAGCLHLQGLFLQKDILTVNLWNWKNNSRVMQE